VRQNTTLEKVGSKFLQLQELQDRLAVKLKFIEQHESHADEVKNKILQLEKMDTQVEDKLRRIHTKSDELS
jgi:transcriptional accessory protein Tex/SPT6